MQNDLVMQSLVYVPIVLPAIRGCDFGFSGVGRYSAEPLSEDSSQILMLHLFTNSVLLAGSIEEVDHN